MPAETTPRNSWNDCDGHEWRDIEAMSDHAVVCSKCGAPGDRNPKTGEVYWPAT